MTSYDSSPFSLSIFDQTNIMAVIEIFSDGSNMAGYTSVASLIFRKKHLKPFEKEWDKMRRRFGISHFHMTDCSAARKEFEGWTFEQRDACAREAISILVKYPLKGMAFTVKNQDFYDIIGENGIMPNPITLGVWATLFDVRHWADTNYPDSRISYIFESGDSEQPSINNLLNSIAEDPIRSKNARYRNHAFVPKLKSYPTQAADIIAWHAAKHAKRRAEGKPMRPDFSEIVSKLSISDVHHDRNFLEGLVEIAKKNAGPNGERLAALVALADSTHRTRGAGRIGSGC